jgi:hypothetical protein
MQTVDFLIDGLGNYPDVFKLLNSVSFLILIFHANILL